MRDNSAAEGGEGPREKMIRRHEERAKWALAAGLALAIAGCGESGPAGPTAVTPTTPVKPTQTAVSGMYVGEMYVAHYPRGVYGDGAETGPIDKCQEITVIGTTVTLVGWEMAGRLTADGTVVEPVYLGEGGVYFERWSARFERESFLLDMTHSNPKIPDLIRDFGELELQPEGMWSCQVGKPTRN